MSRENDLKLMRDLHFSVFGEVLTEQQLQEYAAALFDAPINMTEAEHDAIFEQCVKDAEAYKSKKA